MSKVVIITWGCPLPLFALNIGRKSVIHCHKTNFTDTTFFLYKLQYNDLSWMFWQLTNISKASNILYNRDVHHTTLHRLLNHKSWCQKQLERETGWQCLMHKTCLRLQLWAEIRSNLHFHTYFIDFRCCYRTIGTVWLAWWISLYQLINDDFTSAVQSGGIRALLYFVSFKVKFIVLETHATHATP